MSSILFSVHTLLLSDSRGATELARDTDVNALSGLVKLYFRELPEALFTDILYPQLVDLYGFVGSRCEGKMHDRVEE